MVVLILQIAAVRKVLETVVSRLLSQRRVFITIVLASMGKRILALQCSQPSISFVHWLHTHTKKRNLLHSVLLYCLFFLHVFCSFIAFTSFGSLILSSFVRSLFWYYPQSWSCFCISLGRSSPRLALKSFNLKQSCHTNPLPPLTVSMTMICAWFYR